MGRVITRLAAARAARIVRALLVRADRMHPAALLVLVLVLGGLVYVTAPQMAAFLVAVVDTAEAAVYIAGGGILARLAVRTAATFRRPAPAPAAKIPAPTPAPAP
ncbi:hypothetical protein [Streptomyces jumonjinensis]|uniref:hypothetical protein n=1 Tax=Streptomyces jumonjinensis TaxID=1945 RepID=UPI0037AA79BB